MFEYDYDRLSGRLQEAQELVVQIHSQMNTRDSTIVKDIKEKIDDVVHTVISIPSDQ